ncbi:MAG: integrase [Ilumatobacteraceae bacterium]|nr:integrase [Ilumatobacteraceae bacterium]
MSIERRGTKGSYRYRGVVRFAGQKQHTSWVKTEAEARMAESALHTELGGNPKPTGHTVAELAAGTIADLTGRRSPGTISFYREGEALIPPAFGSRDVSSVKPLIVDALYRQLRTAGASEHKINKVHKLLSVSFSRGVKYGWCASNPCSAADKPQARAAEIVPPSPEDVRALLACASDVNADLAVCLRLAAATGMRRGELVALQWRDLNKLSLTIRRSLVEADGGLHVRNTKTGSRGHRSIRIGADMVALLEALRERQAAYCETAGVPVPEWCFSHDLETPWRPEYLTTAFARLTSDFTLHGLRHFHATQLLAAGVPVATVSHRLGHSSPAVTLNTYSHWIPASDEYSAELIEQLL